VLTWCDDSSSVVGRLGEQTKGQNSAALCFYFDFEARKQRTVTRMLK